MLFVFSSNHSIGQDYHTPLNCLGDGVIDWGTGAGQVNWPAGNLSLTASNVRGTGHDFTFTITGATGNLLDAAGTGVTPPGIADWGHSSKSEDRLYLGTSGIGVSNNITITIDISPSIPGDLGFDIYHFNSTLNHGDHLTAMAVDDNNTTVYATFTGTASPNWSTAGQNPGEVNSTGSNGGDDDQLGVNFSSATPIKQIVLVWEDCDSCNPPDLHALSIGDINFCYNADDRDGDGVADYKDIDSDNDGIADLMEICGTHPPVASTSTILVEIKTDAYPGETSWDIRNGDNTVVASASSLTNSDALYTWTETVSAHEDYTFTIYDSYGDALTWAPTGYYNVSLNGVSIPGSNVTNDWGSQDQQTISAVEPPLPGPFDCVTSQTDPSLDDDFDGTPNYMDSDYCTLNANGVCSSLDTDGDGVPDYLDLDADNDGIPDLVEAGAPDPDNDGRVDTGALPWDTDNDGLADIYDTDDNTSPGTNDGGNALISTTSDTNGNGILDNTEVMESGGGSTVAINIDSDDTPNHLDLDSDNDGVTDVVENSGGDIDADHGGSGALDGIVNNYTDTADNNGWNDSSNSAELDTDGDNIPDYLDIDADNDGIPDYLEAVCTTCPTAALPTGNDSDGDGVLDIFENMSNDNTGAGINTGTNPNMDNDDLSDTTPDYLDTDTDEDGAWDWDEGFDSNGNGKANDDLISAAANYEAANSNPGHYATTDTDADDIPDWLDNQPTVPGYNENLRPPFLDESSSFWQDSNNNGLVDLLDVLSNGTLAPTPNLDNANDADWRDQLTLVALPVELARFVGTTKDCDVNLVWTSQTEERFSHYELERSPDGTNYEMIEKINAAGGLNSRTYQYTDISALERNYYRLKMVDLDGSIAYSEVLEIKTQCDVIENILLYPNPVVNQDITIKIKSRSEASEDIMISNLLGQVVYKGVLNLNEGFNTFQYSTSEMLDGIYIIRIGARTKAKFTKIGEE